ncbi:MAG: copper amine oxidase N-terminal domain-containing protein [Defluviitaleaceae bacterium]|nr:copper amine oxidase N-terminal domain-containing protein [Defluviitaleaceae bacterium]MCL2263855.1 copper amine oxidase N-terminal domain-containing protein [Defluviitaleaceae bacterium]
MKKLCALVFLAAMCLMPASVALASEINVTINGQAVSFPGGQGAVIVDGRTLVPVRGVFEMLGFTVDWDTDTRTAFISNAEYEVRISVGQGYFTTNGARHNLDVPAQLINERTLVPIRLPLEMVGFYVGWSEVLQTVVITSDNPARPDNATVPIESSGGAFMEILQPSGGAHSLPPDGTERLSEADVREIGTRYIRDVFGLDISDMNMSIQFHHLAASPFPGIAPAPPSWSGLVAGFDFRIDDATGQVVDLSRTPPVDFSENTPEETFHIFAFQGWSAQARWNDLGVEERIALSNITPQALERYRNKATELAQRFAAPYSISELQLTGVFSERTAGANNEPLTDAQLQRMYYERRVELSGDLVADVFGISFTTTDANGQEIGISVPTETCTPIFNRLTLNRR